MKVIVYKDNTFPLDIKKFCRLSNSVCKHVSFKAGKSSVHIASGQINCPESFKILSQELIKESAEYDLVVIATGIRYDNNYFFESYGNKVIVSFSGWHMLTNIPASNGLAYFICSILGDLIDLGLTHDTNKGCLNDFWYDKTGIDVGMRSAFICAECEQRTDLTNMTIKQVYADIVNYLDVISSSSRKSLDILELDVEPGGKKTAPEFDVFLCHNSDDKPLIRIINQELENNSIKTWIDEKHLTPGKPWQMELEEQIENIGSAAVFVGENGMGPWQRSEVWAFLNEFVNRGCPVIPVILINVKTTPELPIFLKQMTWVDLRKDYQNGIARLCTAIKQKKP